MPPKYKKFKIVFQLETPDGVKKAIYEVDIDNDSIKDIEGIEFRTLEQKDAIHTVLFKLIEFLKMKIDWQIVKVIKLDNQGEEIEEIE